MEIKDEYYKAYFGKAYEKYLPLARKYENGEGLPFKFYAFSFGYYWLFYRKLYKIAFLSLLALIILGGLSQFVLAYFQMRDEDLFATILVWLNMFFIGYFGNVIYIKKAQVQIKKVLNTGLEESEIIAKLRSKGGVSWIAVSCTAMVQIGLIILGEYSKTAV